MIGLKHVAVVAALCGLAGCEDGLVKEASDWADRMCACDTSECAKKVNEAFEAWTHTKKREDLTRERIELVMPHVERYFKCYTKAVPASERRAKPLPRLPAEMPEGGLPAEAPAP